MIIYIEREHFGILWGILTDGKETNTGLLHCQYLIEYNREDKCWSLYKNDENGFDPKNLIVENQSLMLLLMIAREIILEELSSGFKPAWEMVAV